MPQWTLCVRFGTQSVPGCIPTQSVGTITLNERKSAHSFRIIGKIPLNPSPQPL